MVFSKRIFCLISVLTVIHSPSHAGKFNPEEWKMIIDNKVQSKETLRIYELLEKERNFGSENFKEHYLLISNDNLYNLNASISFLEAQNSETMRNLGIYVKELTTRYKECLKTSEGSSFALTIWQSCFPLVSNIKSIFRGEDEKIFVENIEAVFETQLNSFQSPFLIYTQSFHKIKKLNSSNFPIAVFQRISLENDLRGKAKNLLKLFHKIETCCPPSWKKRIALFKKDSATYFNEIFSFAEKKPCNLSQQFKFQISLQKGLGENMNIREIERMYDFLMFYQDMLFNFTKLKFRHKENKSIISFTKDDEKIFADILAGISHASPPKVSLQKPQAPVKVPDPLPAPMSKEESAAEKDSLVSPSPAAAMEENIQGDSLVVPAPQEKELEDNPVESLRAQLRDIQTTLEEDMENVVLYRKAADLLKQLDKNASEPVLSQLQEAASNLYTRYREVKPKNKSSIIVPKNHEDIFLRLMYTPLCYLKDNVRFASIKTLIEGLGGKVHDDCAGSRIKITLGKETCGIHIHDKHNNLIDGGRIASLRTFFLDANVQLKDD